MQPKATNDIYINELNCDALSPLKDIIMVFRSLENTYGSDCLVGFDAGYNNVQAFLRVTKAKNEHNYNV